MSMKEYQGDLARFLRVELPVWEFAPSRYLVELLERLADAEAQRDGFKAACDGFLDDIAKLKSERETEGKP
jgi:hypothetical protein